MIQLLLSVLFLLSPVSTEPYGGCDEAWQAPHSAGAIDCAFVAAR